MGLVRLCFCWLEQTIFQSAETSSQDTWAVVVVIAFADWVPCENLGADLAFPV